MKKLLSLLLCLCLVIGLVGTAAATEKDPLPRFKIVYMYSNFTDKLGSQLKSSMEYIADDMNVDMVFVESGYGEAANAAMEAAVAAGDIDGIVLQQAPSSGILNATKGVPVMVAGNMPSSDAEMAEAATYENFLGCILENSAESGRLAADALYEAGCRNIGFAALTLGMTAAHDDRGNAFKARAAELDGMKIVAEDYSRGKYADAVSSFAAAFPEMDGLYTTGGNDAILNTMQTEGLVGYVKLACVDVSNQTGNYFDNGTLVWCAGGQYGTTMIAFAILYNYLADGTRIIEDVTVPMRRHYMIVRNSEEFADYIKAVDSGVPVYVGSEIKDMIHYYNDAVDTAYIEAINEAYSLEEVLTRHADLLP